MTIPQSNEVGVNWSVSSGKWYASFKRGGKLRYVGTFDNIEDAVVARDAALSDYEASEDAKVYKSVWLDDLIEIVDVLRELSGDVTANLDREYPVDMRDTYPTYKRRYDNDMDIVRRAQVMISKYTT